MEEVTRANSLHMMWLLPQYIIMTCGEILFSVTALEFAYTQSPTTMKAVVQALYKLTSAGGNLINWIVIAALSPYFKKQARPPPLLIATFGVIIWIYLNGAVWDVNSY